MMTTSPRLLFRPDESWTNAALALDHEIDKALRPVLEKWINHATQGGYRVRDFEYIAHAVITDLCLGTLLEKQGRG